MSWGKSTKKKKFKESGIEPTLIKDLLTENRVQMKKRSPVGFEPALSEPEELSYLTRALNHSATQQLRARDTNVK